MKFTETKIPGAFVLDIERTEDERGLFARTWDIEEFGRHSLETRLAQCSISWNRKAGTLRGLHYQASPYEEVKLVRCTLGSAIDVVVDLRPALPTFRSWFSVELSAENRRMVYIPQGCAHGFQTLVDGTELFYQISEPYRSEYARGVRWDDDTLQIVWPLRDAPIVSTRDAGLPTMMHLSSGA